jgi:hypothetical protein
LFTYALLPWLRSQPAARPYYHSCDRGQRSTTLTELLAAMPRWDEMKNGGEHTSIHAVSDEVSNADLSMPMSAKFDGQNMSALPRYFRRQLVPLLRAHHQLQFQDT